MCHRCGQQTSSPANLRNHLKWCLGAVKGVCPFCHQRRSATNMAKHKSVCPNRPSTSNTTNLISTAGPSWPTVKCPRCHQTVTRTNMARHQRSSACRPPLASLSLVQPGTPRARGGSSRQEEGGSTPPLSAPLTDATEDHHSENDENRPPSPVNRASSRARCGRCGCRVDRSEMPGHLRGPCRLG